MLGSLTLMGPMAIDIFLPALPEMGRYFGVDEARTQAIIATYLAGLSIGQPIYGPLSDRFGRRPVLLFGAVLYIAASFAAASAQDIDQLLIARFVQALGACAGTVIGRAVVRDLFDHRETARMLSLMMLIVALAPIVAPIVGSALLLAGSWRVIFWVVFAYSIYAGFLIAFRLPETRSEATAERARSEHPFRAYLSLLTMRRLLGYVLAGAANGAILFTYVASAPGLIIETYGMPVALFPVIFAINALAILIGHHFNRKLLTRMHPDDVLAKATLVLLVLTAILALAAATGFGGPWTVLPLIFFVLGSYGFVGGNTMAGALSVDPLRAGSASALMGAASFGSGALAAALTGILHDGTARPTGVAMFIAVCCSTAALRFLALPRSGKA